MSISDLHTAIAAVCPIVGVSKSRIDFDESATEQQKTAARQVFDDFDWNTKSSTDSDLERIKEILSRFETATAAEKWEAVGKFLRKRING